MSDIMTVNELSEYLNIKVPTVYKYASSGILPGFKFGTAWRFRRSTIDAWIKKQEERHEKKNYFSGLSG